MLTTGKFTATMIEGSIIGVAAGAAGSHASRLTTPPDETQEKQREHLSSIQDILSDMRDFFHKNAQRERFDRPIIITLFKQGFGPAWIPLKMDDQYLRIYALQPTPVLVSSPLAPPTTIVIPQVTLPTLWIPFDFPDQSSFYLDPSASANQLSIYARFTNVEDIASGGSPNHVTLDVGSNFIGNVALSSLYPAGSIPVDNSSGNQANGVATATLPGVAGRTTYITGFEITGAGATAALVVTVTVSNLINGALSYTYTFVAGAAVANQALFVQFPAAIPANAQNTPIAVSCPASGAGGTNNTVDAHGYQL